MTPTQALLLRHEESQRVCSLLGADHVVSSGWGIHLLQQQNNWLVARGNILISQTTDYDRAIDLFTQEVANLNSPVDIRPDQPM